MQIGDRFRTYLSISTNHACNILVFTYCSTSLKNLYLLSITGALGVMYEYGIGVRQNTDSAYVCLKGAADRGNVYAMGNLVANYYRRKLYTKAADLASR